MRLPRILAAAALAPPLTGAALLLLANPAAGVTPVIVTHTDVWAIPVPCGHGTAPSHDCMQYLVSRDGKRTHFDLHVGQWCQEDIYTGTPPSSPLTAPVYSTGDRHLIAHRTYACGPTEEQPSPTPTPTTTPTPVPTSTPSPTGTPSPTPTPSASVTPSDVATPTPSSPTSPPQTPLPSPSASVPTSPSPSSVTPTTPTSGLPSPTGSAPAAPAPTPTAPSTTPTLVGSPTSTASTQPTAAPSIPATGSPVAAPYPSRPESPGADDSSPLPVHSRGVPPTSRTAGPASLAHTGVYDVPRMVMAGMLLIAAGVFATAWARRRRT